MLQDSDEWHKWRHVGDDVLHIELRRFGRDCNFCSELHQTLADLCEELLTAELVYGQNSPAEWQVSLSLVNIEGGLGSCQRLVYL